MVFSTIHCCKNYIFVQEEWRMRLKKIGYSEGNFWVGVGWGGWVVSHDDISKMFSQKKKKNKKHFDLH